MTEDTAKWLEALRRKDESTVGELVRTYGEPLKRYLSAMVRNHSDGEELAQETLIRFLDGLRSFRGEASIKTYLFKIAHNLALNHLASSARVHEVFPGDLPEAQPTDADHAQDLVQAGERARMLRMALMQLPPQQRSVVALRTWQDLSFKEIAGVLSLAEGTVKAHYFFGLRNLRKTLEAPHDS
jgi:RNA polymerase sigma-70 factor (ECF subfamily)